MKLKDHRLWIWTSNSLFSPYIWNIPSFMKWKIFYGKSYTKKIVYFGVELSIYLINKARIVTSWKNDLLWGYRERWSQVQPDWYQNEELLDRESKKIVSSSISAFRFFIFVFPKITVKRSVNTAWKLILKISWRIMADDEYNQFCLKSLPQRQ